MLNELLDFALGVYFLGAFITFLWAIIENVDHVFLNTIFWPVRFFCYAYRAILDGALWKNK